MPDELMPSAWRTGHAETVNAVITNAVAGHGDQPYVDFSGDIYTYAQVDAESAKLAAGLAALGVKRGDTVASVLDNTPDAIFAWFAINKLGAVSVPVNTAYKGEFLRHQIADSGAAVVLAERDYALRVLDVSVKLPKLRHLLHRGDAIDAVGAAVRIAPLDSHKVDAAGFQPEPIGPADLAMLIYTSGTTGPSKGCMISHGYVCNLARQYLQSASLQASDILWTALPLFHMNATATTVLGTAMVGARAAIYPRFSVSGFWPDIARSGATAANLLGSMAPLLADAAQTEAVSSCFGQLRLVNSAPFPHNLQDKWRRRFGVQRMGSAGYGLTEAAMVVTARIGEDCPAGAAGRRNEDFEVIIADDNDEALPDGQTGEVLIRPLRPNVMFQGYWNRAEATVAILRNMWLHSGDIGKFDVAGNFYFVDRKKDYLRRRGENISSFEMENTFRAHAAIADVAVHAVFSELGEDDVKVTAILTAGADLKPEELCRWAIDRVPYFAVPRYIEFRQDLPRNPTGKVLKYQLREEGCTAATWDREKAEIVLSKR